MVISFHYSEVRGMAEIINSFLMDEIILFIFLLPGNTCLKTLIDTPVGKS